MKILLVCPEYPETFWSFKHAARFVSRRAAQPPLGLLTVAALLPADWEIELIDMNVETLPDERVRWCDYVFLGGMSVQEASAREVIARCNALGTRIVAGGPMFTARHADFEGVDHFVLNEAELTLPQFLDDLVHGRPQKLYSTSARADLASTPVPRWDLVDQRAYLTMNIQYSRGCPHDCEFCEITVLDGRRPRTKPVAQLVGELDGLYDRGWRGHVFIVDDNFIGNPGKLKQEILPAVVRWMEARRHPFSFGTQATLNLSRDPVLVDLMARAGFTEVFVGIENPNEESLKECGKDATVDLDLLESVRTLQRAGMEVQGGFILGFDHDPPSIFDTLFQFIQASGIVVAMVGLLNAPVSSRLHHRLRREGRLRDVWTGNNTDATINFVPTMGLPALLEGYARVLQALYAPEGYYRRVDNFLLHHRPLHLRDGRIRAKELQALAKSMLLLGVIERGRLHYWRLFFWSLLRRPRQFPTAIACAVYGYHFRRVLGQHFPRVD